MSDVSRQRQSRRYPIRLPFLHTPRSSTANGIRIGWTRDLSERGACVELDRSVSASTHLQVSLQTDRGVIDAEVEVVWARETLVPEGGILHGLAFTHLTRQQLQALLQVLLSWGLTRRPAVRVPFQVAVTCQLKGEGGPPLQGQARNVSRDGLLLRLPQVVPPGTPLELTLHTQSGPLRVEGKVVWVAPPEGRTPGGLVQHGLRFTALEWSTALTLALDLVGPLEGGPWLASRGGTA